jgi:hypothetical protein
MHIELRKLRVVATLSEETACYTAEIWIDGVRSFAASNRGHGGADDYHQLGSVTEAEVNEWLRANRTARVFHGLTLEPSLEHEVAHLMDVADQAKALKRKLRTGVITIENGAVYTYPLKGRPPAAVIASIRKGKPGAEILNDGGDAAIDRAVTLLLAQDDAPETT